MRKDIVQIQQNFSGKDYVIGDLHGSAGLLSVLTSNLASQDRLFICGDLFDRGEDSLQVYKIIRDINASCFPKKQIFAVRGNHEDDLLKIYYLSKKLRDTKNDFDCVDTIKLIAKFIKNGGEWIFQSEYFLSRINLLRKLKNEVNSQDPALINYFEEIISLFKNPASFIPEFDEITEYLLSLPYIIVCGDISNKISQQQAFIICHADMPFSDCTLRSRLSTNRLTESEISYCTLARPAELRKKAAHDATTIKETNHPRDAHSVLAFCGHTTYLHGGQAIRSYSNTVNLDSCAYAENIMPCVCVTESYVISVITHDTKRSRLNPNLEQQLDELERFLETRRNKKLQEEKQRHALRLLPLRITFLPHPRINAKKHQVTSSKKTLDLRVIR